MLPSAETPVSPTGGADLPLDEIQIQILLSLLQGKDPEKIIRSGRLMSSLVADEINEALFDAIGDTVISCEEEKLSLIEDYREDVEQLLRGSTT